MPDQALNWVDPAGGVTLVRKGSDVATAVGAAGRSSPPPLFVVERVPLQPGQRFRTVVHGPVTVHVPVTFHGIGDTPAARAAALRTTVRQWAFKLDPTRGDGRLQVTSPLGDQRELVCRCSGGLDSAV